VNSLKMALLMLILVSVPLVAAGCADGPTRLARTYSRAALGDVDIGQAWATCEDVMRSEFGRVKLDRSEATIDAQPVYFLGDAPSLSKQRLRRTAKLLLKRHNQKWWAYVRVQVDRLDTSAYQQFSTQRTARDHQFATPMETDETAPWPRQQVWSRLRRDRAGEKAILARIRRQMGLHDPNTGVAEPD